MKKAITITALIGCTLLTACASSAEDTQQTAQKAEKDPRIGERVDRVCFRRDIDGFSNTGKRSVVLHRSRTEKYYVETGNCPPLRRAQRLGLDSNMSCIGRGDRLIVSENFFAGNDREGLNIDRCFINAIYKWNPDAKADDEKPNTESAE